MQFIKFLVCQFLAVLAVYLCIYLATWTPDFRFIVFFQAFIAASLSMLVRQAIWWRVIHLAFIPAVAALLTLNLPSWLYLSIFILLTLVFWGTLRGDVPLFLSSVAVSDALQTILDKERAVSFVDIGAGIGTIVAPLARRSPTLRIVAMEQAPLPWLLGYWRCFKLKNVDVRYGSLWDCDLAIYAVVFAFLSPAVMLRLAEKVRREMPIGGLFISSSFPAPDWRPEAVIEIGDRRRTRLYCYRIQSEKISDKQ
jgi:hypothetical protein